ncbi:probable threonine protease PRSS50 [Pteropus alecto]|uniref:probable threonine protease PRSS50 n=1 Tax=Pteropus alecto TaxID=9402 RepID=UPI0003F146AA|nr:probable threonine protease PRSS50 [Pteropus alecto]
MEPWCRTPAPSVDQAVLLRLLLLLLLRPASCLSSTVAPGALSSAAPTNPGTLCAPGAACHSGGPHVPQQTPTTQMPLTLTQMSQSPVSQGGINLPPRGCGMSYEFDPTLRDPASKVRRWPWMVSVQANGTHICAGSLIASRWVLTVAHCLIQDDVIYSVRVGSPWINQTAQTTSDVPVRRLIVNSRFQSRRYWSWVGKANNIGLLQLERSLKYSEYVWPICLPGLDYELKDYSVCTVMGWGLPRVDGRWPQFRTIQEKEVTILNNKECDNFYHKFTKISSLIRIINSQMICAKDTHREHFCYEISGEPLACPVENTWYLVGMVTWGPGCKHSEAPPIYLRVSAYQSWIWDSISGQAPPALSRALLLALLLPLGLLAAR